MPAERAYVPNVPATLMTAEELLAANVTDKRTELVRGVLTPKDATHASIGRMEAKRRSAKQTTWRARTCCRAFAASSRQSFDQLTATRTGSAALRSADSPATGPTEGRAAGCGPSVRTAW